MIAVRNNQDEGFHLIPPIQTKVRLKNNQNTTSGRVYSGKQKRGGSGMKVQKFNILPKSLANNLVMLLVLVTVGFGASSIAMAAAFYPDIVAERISAISLSPKNWNGMLVNVSGVAKLVKNNFDSLASSGENLILKISNGDFDLADLDQSNFKIKLSDSGSLIRTNDPGLSFDFNFKHNLSFNLPNLDLPTFKVGLADSRLRVADSGLSNFSFDNFDLDLKLSDARVRNGPALSLPELPELPDIKIKLSDSLIRDELAELPVPRIKLSDSLIRNELSVVGLSDLRIKTSDSLVRNEITGLETLQIRTSDSLVRNAVSLANFPKLPDFPNLPNLNDLRVGLSDSLIRNEISLTAAAGDFVAVSGDKPDLWRRITCSVTGWFGLEPANCNGSVDSSNTGIVNNQPEPVAMVTDPVIVRTNSGSSAKLGNVVNNYYNNPTYSSQTVVKADNTELIAAIEALRQEFAAYKNFNLVQNERIFTRIGKSSSDDSDSTSVDLTTIDGSAITNSSFSGSVTASSFESSAALELNDITPPGVTTDLLYNDGGDLYWNGSVIGGSVGSWSTSGSNVYRATGNVGIGTSSPYARLSVVGQVVGAYFTATSTTASTFPYASTTALTVSGTAFIGSLDGPLQANSGLVSATTSIGVTYGGTGLTTAPSYGNILVGNSSGGYALTATSSLGISGSQWTTSGSDIYYNTGNVGIATTSPYSMLSVAGQVVARNFVATSTTATSSANIFSVGSTTPSGNSLFSVGTSTPRLVIDNVTGAVGIGKSDPVAGYSLNTLGDVLFSGLNPGSGLFGITASGLNMFSFTRQTVAGQPGMALTALGGLGFVANSGTASTAYHAVIDINGNVGIATTSPYSMLSVAGQVVAQNFVATSTTATSSALLFGVGSTTPGSTSVFSVGTSSPLLHVGSVNGFVGVGTTNPLDLFAVRSVSGGSEMFTIGRMGCSGGYMGFAVGSLGGNSCASYNFLSDGNSAFFNAPSASGAVLFRVQNSTKMQMTAAGKLGIGTTTPNNLLDIYSTSKSAIGFTGASGPNYKWTIGMDVTNGGRFAIASSTALGTTDRFVIDGNGSVGIASTTPWKTLSVVGTMAVNGLTALVSTADAICLNSTTKEVLVNTGAPTCTASSKRFKHDIEPLDSSLDKVMRLRPVTFAYNGSEERRVGFVAEDVDLIDPRFVFREADGTPRGVRYEDLVSLLTKAIQEQDVRITGLDTSLKTVTARMDELVAILGNATGTPAIGAGALRDSLIERIKASIASSTNWAVTRITAGFARVERVDVDVLTVNKGIEIKDSVTGDTYCLTMRDGKFEHDKGTCAEVEQNHGQPGDDNANNNDHINNSPVQPAPNPNLEQQPPQNAPDEKVEDKDKIDDTPVAPSPAQEVQAQPAVEQPAADPKVEQLPATPAQPAEVDKDKVEARQEQPAEQQQPAANQQEQPKDEAPVQVAPAAQAPAAADPTPAAPTPQPDPAPEPTPEGN